MKSTGFKLVGAIAVLIGVGFIYINSNFGLIPPRSSQSSSSPQIVQLPTLAATAVALGEEPVSEAAPEMAEDQQESLAILQPTYTPASNEASQTIVQQPDLPKEVKEAVETSPVSTELPAGENGRLFISKVDLSADIVKVPIVEDQWLVEELGADIGLLEGGGRFPGDEKSMILAGHATTFWPIKGPFAKLAGLVPNDQIVYLFEGQEYTYQISRLIWADPDNINILNSDNGNQIILVTCGKYDYFVGRYDQRLVVLADLIDIKPIQTN